MSRIKNKLIHSENIKSTSPVLQNETLDMLKRAWKKLPSDFTMGERSLFFEIAEKLIKVSEDKDKKLN